MIKYNLREDLEGFICSIFRIADHDNRHQALDAFRYDGTTSFEQLTRCIPEDIQSLTKEVEGGKRVAISRSCMTLLLVLMEMIDEIDMELPWYKCDTFEDFFNRDTFMEYFYSKSQENYLTLTDEARESSYRGVLEENINKNDDSVEFDWDGFQDKDEVVDVTGVTADEFIYDAFLDNIDTDLKRLQDGEFVDGKAEDELDEILEHKEVIDVADTGPSDGTRNNNSRESDWKGLQDKDEKFDDIAYGIEEYTVFDIGNDKEHYQYFEIKDENKIDDATKCEEYIDSDTGVAEFGNGIGYEELADIAYGNEDDDDGSCRRWKY